MSFRIQTHFKISHICSGIGCGGLLIRYKGAVQEVGIVQCNFIGVLDGSVGLASAF